jgi:hypothetical protein
MQAFSGNNVKKVPELAQNLFFGLLGLGHNVESADSFSVKAEVLGERLGYHELMAVLQKESDWENVLLEISGGVTLVGGVKQGENLFGKDQLGEGFPLVDRQINTSWVVGTSVEEND